MVAPPAFILDQHPRTSEQTLKHFHTGLVHSHCRHVRDSKHMTAVFLSAEKDLSGKLWLFRLPPEWHFEARGDLWFNWLTATMLAWGRFSSVTRAHADVMHQFPQHNDCQYVSRETHRYSRSIRADKWEQSVGLSLCWQRLSGRLNSPPLHRQSGWGAQVIRAQAEARFHFQASKSHRCCNTWSPGSRGFPAALLANAGWPRIQCGGAQTVGIAFRSVSASVWKSEQRGRVSVALAEWAQCVNTTSTLSKAKSSSIISQTKATPLCLCQCWCMFTDSARGLIHSAQLACHHKSSDLIRLTYCSP